VSGNEMKNDYSSYLAFARLASHLRDGAYLSKKTISLQHLRHTAGM
jgi:hypothetical protein